MRRHVFCFCCPCRMFARTVHGDDDCVCWVRCFENCTYPPLPWPTGGDYSCTDLDHNRACWGGKICTTSCYPTESLANNFIVLRSMKGSRFGNSLYAQFATGDQGQQEIDFKNLSFVEFYDIDSDPWMMLNLAQAPATPHAALAAELHRWYNCRGKSCP